MTSQSNQSTQATCADQVVTGKAKPSIGDEISCADTDIVFLGSNVPCVRITQVNGQWYPHSEAKKGLIVRILRPLRIRFKGGIRIRITGVYANFAHAEVIGNA